ncbi:MAG: rSAM/selenodomain-associated transferase 2 [Bacteroidia bacterium]|jgi:rSAM/selenodomain-associated transferase 2
MNLSIIIPTLNEEEYISNTLNKIEESISKGSEFEIIVIDAGSKDRTLDILKGFDCRVDVKKEFKGRKYESLNYGASIAKGDVLFFLDADSFVPNEFNLKIEKALKKTRAVAGAFEYQAENESIEFRVIQLINRLRYRVDGLYFGDQGIFCLRNTFEDVGGYPEEPIMEASFLCRKLRSAGKMNLIKSPIITSTRRFDNSGVCQVFFNDMIIWMRFLLRMDIKKYASAYWEQNEIV